MRLVLNTGAVIDYGTVLLPDGLLWEDEFKWVPAIQSRSYSITGALLIDTAIKLAGRPITLSATQDMGWISRTTMLALKTWSSLQNRVFTLTFEYPTDTRSFTVMFDQSGDSAIEGHPVKGFPSTSADDWYNVKIKFIEV